MPVFSSHNQSVNPSSRSHLLKCKVYCDRKVQIKCRMCERAKANLVLRMIFIYFLFARVALTNLYTFRWRKCKPEATTSPHYSFNIENSHVLQLQLQLLLLAYVLLLIHTSEFISFSLSLSFFFLLRIQTIQNFCISVT